MRAAKRFIGLCLINCRNTAARWTQSATFSDFQVKNEPQTLAIMKCIQKCNGPIKSRSIYRCVARVCGKKIRSRSLRRNSKRMGREWRQRNLFIWLCALVLARQSHSLPYCWKMKRNKFSAVINTAEPTNATSFKQSQPSFTRNEKFLIFVVAIINIYCETESDAHTQRPHSLGFVWVLQAASLRCSPAFGWISESLLKLI